MPAYRFVSLFNRVINLVLSKRQWYHAHGRVSGGSASNLSISWEEIKALRSRCYCKLACHTAAFCFTREVAVTRVEIEMLLRQASPTAPINLFVVVLCSQLQFATLATAVDNNQAAITRHVFQRCLGPLGHAENIISRRVFDVVRPRECDADKSGCWFRYLNSAML
jgi:hypothetical protein